MLRYRLPEGRRDREPALLIRANDRTALKAAGIRRAFGYFVGTVPRRARQVVAEAHGRSGLVLGRLAFDRLAAEMHPTVFIAHNQ